MRINHFISYLAKNIIAPPYCAHCKSFMYQDTIFCEVCVALIMPIVSTAISLTKKHTMKVFAISDYKDPIKSLILAKGSSHIIASYQLGNLLWQMTNIKNVPVDFFVPIPLHWKRLAYRGYNQAYEIAKILAKESGNSVMQPLKRMHHTVHQSTLTYDQRARNVKNVFDVVGLDKERYRNAHIMLVDDLMTTGATLQEAGRELLKLKPASIMAVVACRVV